MVGFELAREFSRQNENRHPFFLPDSLLPEKVNGDWKMVENGKMKMGKERSCLVNIEIQDCSDC